MTTIAPVSSYSPARSPVEPTREPIVTDDPFSAWNPATRIAFRFCFVYFALYVITTQMLPGMTWWLPDFGVLPPTRNLFIWIGQHILAISGPISYRSTGSGDKTFDWVQVFSLLLIATIATAAWSAHARQRVHHAKLFAWFRLFLRLALATTFFGYGFAKVIPNQMPVLALTRLVEPFGNFSPMGVLWYSIGAAPAYEIATGCAEVLAGILLFLPRTTTAGALVALMDATMIFLLNMTYDVPVKLFSFHLILMSLFLLAPNALNLFDLFIRHRQSTIREEPPVLSSEKAGRRLVIAQVVFGIAMIGTNAWGGLQGWRTYGGGAPKSSLYGIWDISEMTIDGVAHAPVLTDSTRLRRAIFQTQASATFQRMDDTFRRYTAKYDTTAKTIALTSADSTIPNGKLTYARPDHEHLIMDGTFGTRTVHLAMTFRDPDSFLQRSRGFHFVQEIPFNR